MVDVVDRATRSRMMAGIGPANTAPEMLVRRYLHATGLRYRLHDKRLPGQPDVVLASHNTAVFVHGCFWHRHLGCRFATTPTSNPEFWCTKFQGNVRRDASKEAKLRALGWNVLVVWECEARDIEALENLFWRIVLGA